MSRSYGGGGGSGANTKSSFKIQVSSRQLKPEQKSSTGHFVVSVGGVLMQLMLLLLLLQQRDFVSSSSEAP